MSTGDELSAAQVTAHVAQVAKRFQPSARRTRAGFAAAMGLSAARISHLLNLLKLPTDIQQRLRTDSGLTERWVRAWAAAIRQTRASTP